MKFIWWVYLWMIRHTSDEFFIWPHFQGHKGQSSKWHPLNTKPPISPELLNGIDEIHVMYLRSILFILHMFFIGPHFQGQINLDIGCRLQTFITGMILFQVTIGLFVVWAMGHYVFSAFVQIRPKMCSVRGHFQRLLAIALHLVNNFVY